MITILCSWKKSCSGERNAELTNGCFFFLCLSVNLAPESLLLSDHSLCHCTVSGPFPPFFFSHFLDPKDPIAIERLNLMNMAKLSIKGLIESALNLGRTLDSDYAPLQQFFVVMEHCLKHGLKSM